MIIQLQATQTGSEEDRYKQRSPIYHISVRGLVGIATSAFVALFVCVYMNPFLTHLPVFTWMSVCTVKRRGVNVYNSS